MSRWCFHTSGTAARPKLVPLTHRNLCAAAQNIRAALELTPGDRCLNVMPLFHIHGLSALFASMAAGASVVCTGAFAAQRFFEWMEAFQPTWYTAAPTIHREILDNASHHPGVVARSSLRFIRSASAAMPRQLIADMERVFQRPVHRSLWDDRGGSSDREQPTLRRANGNQVRWGGPPGRTSRSWTTRGT